MSFFEDYICYLICQLLNQFSFFIYSANLTKAPKILVAILFVACCVSVQNGPYLILVLYANFNALSLLHICFSHPQLTRALLNSANTAYKVAVLTFLKDSDQKISFMVGLRYDDQRLARLQNNKSILIR